MAGGTPRSSSIWPYQNWTSHDRLEGARFDLRYRYVGDGWSRRQEFDADPGGSGGAALEDAGISLDQLDAIVSPNSISDTRLRYAQSLAEYLGMSADRLRYVQTDPLGGSASGQAVHQAAMSIISGYASTVLILGGDILQSAAGAPEAQRQMAEVMGKEFEEPYGLSPAAFFAMMTNRYMHDYDVSAETLAGVAVAIRDYSARTPAAKMYGKSVTVEDVLASPLISSRSTGWSVH